MDHSFREEIKICRTWDNKGKRDVIRNHLTNWQVDKLRNWEIDQMHSSIVYFFKASFFLFFFFLSFARKIILYNKVRKLKIKCKIVHHDNIFILFYSLDKVILTPSSIAIMWSVKKNEWYAQLRSSSISVLFIKQTYMTIQEESIPLYNIRSCYVNHKNKYILRMSSLLSVAGLLYWIKNSNNNHNANGTDNNTSIRSDPSCIIVDGCQKILPQTGRL